MIDLLITLIPPFLVLCIAWYSQKLEGALIAGLLSACLLATNFNPYEAASRALQHITNHLFDTDYLLLFGFLCVIGILVQLITHSGVANAAASWMFEKIEGKRQAEYATIGLSSLLCIDDYLSSLTTGTVMSLVTDRFKIPRWRTAYLVHSLASPLVILVPLSSWLAMITTQIESSGISLDSAENPLVAADPFWTYLASIPYIFYSFILIASVIIVIWFQLSPLPAKQAPPLTSTPTTPAPDRPNHAPYILELVYPLLTLFGITIVGLLWSGGYQPLGGITIMQAIKQSHNSALVLLVAASIAALTTATRLTIKGLLRPQQLPHCIYSGISLMFPAIVMIVLAGSLGDTMRDDLHVGTHLLAALSFTSITWIIPPLLFVISMCIGVITGSSWGTIMLVMPLTLPVVIALEGHTGVISLAQTTLLLPAIGAIFSGAVCGDHVSPISETTIMAATSCGINPMLHAKTQMYFVLPVIIGTIIAYTLWGFLNTASPGFRILASLAAGLFICMLILIINNNRYKQR